MSIRSRLEPLALTILRISTGVIMAAHGWQKFSNLPETIQQFASMGIPKPAVYLAIAGELGGGLGLITAPATEAVMGAVPKEKAGIGSAVNDATRLFGAALGVAVMGSIAASLYGSRLAATLPKGLPSQALAATKGSVGGALVVVQSLQRAGLSGLARELRFASTGAFLHSMNGAMIVAGTVAMLGAIMAAIFLPSRPGLALAQTTIVRVEESADIDLESPPAESVS